MKFRNPTASIFIPDGKTVVDTQLELQGSVKLPDDMGGFELSITDPHKHWWTKVFLVFFKIKAFLQVAAPS